MLTELRVENLGIIDELSVTLGAGLTAITGETGAGKTLLVEALDLLLGGRADPSLVRDGATEARRRGPVRRRRRPTVPTTRLEIEVVLARVVPASRPQPRVRRRPARDGRPSSRQHGRALVDLHGQHEQQSLLVPAEQRALLDAFVGRARGARAAAAIAAARAELRAIDDALAELGGDERARARELDLLRFELAEIEARRARATPTRKPRARGRRGRARQRGRAPRRARRPRTARSTGPRPTRSARRWPRSRARAGSPRSRPGSPRCRPSSPTSRTRPASRPSRSSTIPSGSREVRARRQRLRELCRKYGPTLADVQAFAAESADAARPARRRRGASRRARRPGGSGREAALGARPQAQLLAARRAGAPVLAAAVTERLGELALGRAECRIEVDADGAGDDGGEVTFLLAPNPGESARPLAKAASGGELSRVMLALRVVLSEAPPTLVFDEVDAGLGGEAGVAVGRALALLGGKHQVLCVTHLAQVAAFADAQLSVHKEERGGAHPRAASSCCSTTRGSTSCRGCSPGSASRTTPRSHARELLAVAGRQRAEARS